MLVYEYRFFEFPAIYGKNAIVLAIAHNFLWVLFWDRVPGLLQLSKLIFGWFWGTGVEP